MTDPAKHSRWALTLALPHEVKAVLGRMKVRALTRYQGAKFWEGVLGREEIVLVQTGMAPAKASNSAHFLVDRYPITHLLSSGYCGGLREDLRTGDAVVATQVAGSESPMEAESSDSDLVARADRCLEELKIVYHRGRLLTSPKPILKIPEKQKAYSQSQAIAVDMESHAILKAVQSSGKKIASITVRFVVDAAQEELVDTEAFLDENSQVRPFKLAQEILRRPKILLDLPALDRKASQARANMARFFQGFFGVDEHR